MKTNWIARTIASVAALSFVAGYTLPAAAAVPDGINYQGYLTNVSGAPVDTAIPITFAAFDVDVGGVPLWSQTDSVIVDRGLFSVTLGTPANPFPPGIFSGPVYIGLFVAGEEMLPRRQLTSAPYAFQASDSDTLDGLQAADLDQSGDVVTLQGDVAGVDGRVTALEGIGADITGVSAGPGLSGGGASGNVSVSVANGGINATMLSVNSVGSGAIIDGQVGAAEIATGAVGTSEIATDGVTSSDIADGAVGPSKINAGLAYTVNGLTNNGSTQLNGALTIESGADIRIHDDFNGFRWYDATGLTQFGTIFARSSEFSFYDANNNRYAVHSDADGVGIGTTLTNTGYDVSVPSLAVAGQTLVGLQRVSAIYDLSSTSSCHSHGGLPCYYGASSVSCPVGKRVLGGGASGSSGLFGSISTSYPNSNTSWTCGASYDLAGASRTCYAICARLE